MKKPLMPSLAACARWADAALREIGEPLGVGLPEPTETVWTDTLREVWHDHGDKGKFVQWHDNGDGTGRWIEMTPEELAACSPRRRRKVKP